SVLLNRGDGSFQARVDYRTGKSPLSLAIADLNGDGKPDLAIANEDAYSVSVFVNRGDGSFQAKLDYRTGKNPNSLAIADRKGRVVSEQPRFGSVLAGGGKVNVVVSRGRKQ